MKRKRFIPAVLALVLLLSLFGCGKDETVGAAHGGRYEGTRFAMPEGLNNPSLYTVPPLFDVASETLTFYLGSITTVKEPGEEKYEPAILSSLVTSSADGVLREEALPFAPNQSVGCGWLDEDSFTYLFTTIHYGTTGKSDGTYFLGRYERSTGEVRESEEIMRFFDDGTTMVNRILVDADGDIWVLGLREILVFSPDFLHRKTVRCPGDSFASIGVTEDGEVRAAYMTLEMTDTVLVVSSLDKENGAAEERFRIRLNGFRNLCFGPDMALYYAAEAGVFRVGEREDGGAETVLLMDFPLSDVSASSSTFGGVIDRDRFLFTEEWRSGDGNWHWDPVLYTRADPSDPAGAVTVTLAYTERDAELTQRIVDFNKSQKQVRIAVEDYSQFSTAADPEAGDRKLATDITTGLFKPDIVIADPESDAVRQLFARDLCADLGPYVAADDLVNDENLAGAVKNVYGDGKGGLRALSTGVTLISAAAPSSLLGDLASAGYWNASDFAEFAAGLPSDVAFAEIPCREYFEAFLFAADGLGEFIDHEAGTCSFDGPRFRRVLDVLASLPSSDDALKDPAVSDPDAAAERFYTGKIALRDFIIDSPVRVIGLRALFGTEDCAVIGFPTGQARKGAGIRAEMKNAVVLTSFSAHPDEAWGAIRSFFEGNPRMMVLLNGAIPTDPLPTLYSQIDWMIGSWNEGDMEFRFYADGTSEMRRGDRENPTDRAELPKPGIASFFGEEDRARLRELLDSAGLPYGGGVDEQVRLIVSEELSALFGGAGSAEDCAKKIQSRVSIWLAEHS